MQRSTGLDVNNPSNFLKTFYPVLYMKCWDVPERDKNQWDILDIHWVYHGVFVGQCGATICFLSINLMLHLFLKHCNTVSAHFQICFWKHWLSSVVELTQTCQTMQWHFIVANQEPLNIFFSFLKQTRPQSQHHCLFSMKKTNSASSVWLRRMKRHALRNVLAFIRPSLFPSIHPSIYPFHCSHETTAVDFSGEAWLRLTF